MAPADAVARLHEVVANRTDFTEDEVYDAMARAGVPDRVADLAYKFTQTAWGRIYLDMAGVRFSTEYLCFSSVGEVIESGMLIDQPYYVEAIRIAFLNAWCPGFLRLVSMSAEVGAISAALQTGSKPGDLATGPAAFCIGPITSEGMEKAQRLIAQRTSVRGSKPDRKPWWKFW